MLLLTRRVGEVLVINDDINILVLGVNGNQVKIGIDAPLSVPVNRKEIWEKIQRKKLEILK